VNDQQWQVTGDRNKVTTLGEPAGGEFGLAGRHAHKLAAAPDDPDGAVDRRHDLGMLGIAEETEIGRHIVRAEQQGIDPINICDLRDTADRRAALDLDGETEAILTM
jgi:hypothetical protein